MDLKELFNNLIETVMVFEDETILCFQSGGAVSLIEDCYVPGSTDKV